MKKNKVFREIVQRSLWSLARPPEYFAEGSFVIDPQIIETRFRVMLKLFKVFNMRPTKELAVSIDKYVSILSIFGLPREQQIEAACGGVVVEPYIDHWEEKKADISQTFEKKTIESIDDLESFYKSLDKIYDEYSSDQRKEMLSSLKKFCELLSPSSNKKSSPRVHTYDDRISLPTSCAARYWAERKEEENNEEGEADYRVTE